MCLVVVLEDMCGRDVSG
jgi:hypothetical protein